MVDKPLPKYARPKGERPPRALGSVRVFPPMTKLPKAPKIKVSKPAKLPRATGGLPKLGGKQRVRSAQRFRAGKTAF